MAPHGSKIPQMAPLQPYVCWLNYVQSRPKIHSEPCVIDLAEQIDKKILFKKIIFNINSPQHYLCGPLKEWQKVPKKAEGCN